MNLTDSVTPLHVVLAAAVLICAIAALYTPRRLTGVVLFLVFGVFLSSYWAVLGAADVALAEAVIGTGVTGALFGYVATVLPQPGPSDPSANTTGASPARTSTTGRTVVGILGGAGLGAGLAHLLSLAAPESSGLSEPVAHAMPSTGVEHPITGVLLNLRSYDTLMEMVVLLAAVAVALAFLRDPHARLPRAEHQPSPLVKLYVTIVAPVALLLAAWLLFAGSSQPGGAFQSGAALAAVVILLQSSGVRRFVVGPAMISVLLIGVVAFLTVAVGGLVLGDAWLFLRGPWAGTITIALETALAVSIGAGLGVIFLATTVDRQPHGREVAPDA
ncbi:hydrogenase subunit MbhD domain-containing protein [Kocuria sp.]|uniref:hydrogenase subunit MbhD domain-containing protein n=1 Tax=Kocuria sp. TaxID=1871328 RepID=UPI0026DFFAB6|nr:hydrogenase subunit MbhD domain-containing protein [Kocuria sp.]MDO5619617.1 DUF4040 domain-containing protein [Kocuria sp.]